MIGSGPGPRCAAAFSGHPDPAVAVGEVVGRVLDRLDPHPDVAVVLASGTMAAEFRTVAGAVQALLAPNALIGATVLGVFGGPEDLLGTDGTGHGGGLGLWVRTGPGVGTVRLTDDGREPPRWPPEVEPGSTALVLAGRSFRFEQLGDGGSGPRPVDLLGVRMPLRIGGDPALLTDGRRYHHDGAVALVVPGDRARSALLPLTPDDPIEGEPMAGAEREPELRWDDTPLTPPSGPGSGAFLLVDRAIDPVRNWNFALEMALEPFPATLTGLIGDVIVDRPGRDDNPMDAGRRQAALAIR